MQNKKMLWGFSEVCDLYEEYKKHVKNHVNDDVGNDDDGDNGQKDDVEINILLFGSGDPRHIMKAMAKNYQHQVKLNFFILEGCASLIARHTLLLSIVLEPIELLTPLARTHLFMDIYGNSLLRSSSIGYINSKANHLINCITDSTFNEQMQSQIDFGQLKYVERDMLECVLKFWRDIDGNRFDISQCWMESNRQMLKDRFDSRHGIYDWDHQMRLKENGAQQICTQEYGHWRETGIAFTFPEYRQSHANRTFAIQTPMDRKQMHRYIGDMTIGPFCTFGLACNDKNLLRSNYGQNMYRSTDITERNLFELFYEIHEQKPFESELFASHKLGAIKIDTGKILDSESTLDIQATDLKQFNRPTISTPNVRITFLSMHDAQSLIDGQKFQKYFDIVFVGRNYFPILKVEFSQIFKPLALILFETAQLTVQRKPEIAEFLQKIRKMSKEMHLKSISNFNINTPLPVAKFINIYDEVEREREINNK